MRLCILDHYLQHLEVVEIVHSLRNLNNLREIHNICLNQWWVQPFLVKKNTSNRLKMKILFLCIYVLCIIQLICTFYNNNHAFNFSSFLTPLIFSNLAVSVYFMVDVFHLFTASCHRGNLRCVFVHITITLFISFIIETYSTHVCFNLFYVSLPSHKWSRLTEHNLISLIVLFVCWQDLDMLAAQLNELGVVQQNQQPEAPPRNNRNNSKQSQSQVNNNVPVSSAVNNHSSSTSINQQSTNILDPLVDSDSDSEPEDNGRVRNDGTLLASDPPKPLWVTRIFITYKNIFTLN